MSHRYTGPESRNSTLPAASSPLRRLLFRLGAIAAAGVLLYWAVRDAPLAEIGGTLGQITLPQVLVLIVLNLIFHILVGLRWWLVARADVPGLEIAGMVWARLSAFGLSYFTPGPQVGGEPLQVRHLRRNSSATLARATATVVIDRLLELLGNFMVLVVGIALLLWNGTVGAVTELPVLAWAGIVCLLGWPVLHIALLSRGRYPVSAVIRLVRLPYPGSRSARLLRASEQLAGRFSQRHPDLVVVAVGASVLACAIAVTEYGLIAAFLGLELSVWEVIAAWAAGWISFLLPLPGGLGALEASQVMALGAFGVTAASALGVAVLLRLRDLVFGGVGLLIAAASFRGAGGASIIAGDAVHEDAATRRG